MERAAFIRAISSSSLACNRPLFSSPKLARSFLSKSPAVASRRHYHRLIPNLTNRSLPRRGLRRFSRLSAASQSSSLRFSLSNRHFSSLATRAVASPSTQVSPGSISLLEVAYFFLLLFKLILSLHMIFPCNSSPSFAFIFLRICY